MKLSSHSKSTILTEMPFNGESINPKTNWNFDGWNRFHEACTWLHSSKLWTETKILNNFMIKVKNAITAIMVQQAFVRWEFGPWFGPYRCLFLFSFSVNFSLSSLPNKRCLSHWSFDSELNNTERGKSGENIAFTSSSLGQKTYC